MDSVDGGGEFGEGFAAVVHAVEVRLGVHVLGELAGAGGVDLGNCRGWDGRGGSIGSDPRGESHVGGNVWLDHGPRVSDYSSHSSMCGGLELDASLSCACRCVH